MFYVKTYIFDFEKKNIKHNINIRESVCFFDSGSEFSSVFVRQRWITASTMAIKNAEIIINNSANG